MVFSSPSDGIMTTVSSSYLHLSLSILLRRSWNSVLVYLEKKINGLWKYLVVFCSSSCCSSLNCWGYGSSCAAAAFCFFLCRPSYSHLVLVVTHASLAVLNWDKIVFIFQIIALWRTVPQSFPQNFKGLAFKLYTCTSCLLLILF